MKRTLITGASTGLGKEFAKLYAKDNNDLVLVARNYEKLNHLLFQTRTELCQRLDQESQKRQRRADHRVHQGCGRCGRF